MKYENPLISSGGSTTRTSAMGAMILANRRGSVRTRSVRAILPKFVIRIAIQPPLARFGGRDEARGKVGLTYHKSENHQLRQAT